MNYDVQAVRQEFPVLCTKVHGLPLIYLDSAATTLKPLAVIDAVQKYYSQEGGTVHRAVYALAAHATARYDAVRSQLKEWIHAASSDEIVFTKGTTEGINLVAATFGKAFLKPGDEIILSELEHHSNIVPWQFLAQEKGILIKVIPSDERGVLCLQTYKELLSPRTKLVSVAHIANSIGTLHPIEEIISLAHEQGAKVLIDGAQAIAHIPVDVQALDADFYAFSGHKMFGPTGIGVLYGKKELLEALPPYQGGGDMIEAVSFEKTTFRPPPLRFEAGTPPIAQVIGLGAAIDFIETLGRPCIARWEGELLKRATEGLRRIRGVSIIGEAPRKGAVLSFTIDGVHPLDLGTLLDLKGIAVRTGHHCAQPALKRFGLTSTTRASFAPYTTPGEIDTFLCAVEDALTGIRI